MNSNLHCDELTNDQLSKMKQQIISLTPSKIIQEALEISSTNRKNKSQQVKKDEILKATKQTAITQYKNEQEKKNKLQLQQILEEKIDEYNKGTQVIIDKAQKTVEQYVSQYEKSEEEKIHLLHQVTQLNNECNKLETKLKDSENSIFKLQNKFELFSTHMPLFDQFVKDFPSLSPIEIIKDINARKGESIQLLNEINEAKQTIKQLQSEKHSILATAKKNSDESNEKLFQTEKEYKDRIEKYEKDITALESEIATMQTFKDENVFLHKMMFKLYNMLIGVIKHDQAERETMNKNKGDEYNDKETIKLNRTFFDIKESDFSPNLFDNNELGRYVQILISSMKTSTSNKLLRETIAYANMMLRVFMKEKVNLRYDPVETFKNIKTLLESKEEMNQRLSEDNKILKTQNSQLMCENKKLSNQLKHNLLAQASMQHNKTMVRPKTAVKKNVLMTSTNAKPLRKSESLPQMAMTVHVPILQLDKEKDEAKNDPKPIMFNKEGLHNKRAIYSAYSRAIKNQNEIKEAKYSNYNKYHKGKRPYKKDLDNDDVEEEGESSSHSHNVMNKFKDLKHSKSKDKLLKTHGFQSLVSHLNGFQDLVEHTNRLFFYQAKMKAKKNRKPNPALNNNTSLQIGSLSSSFSGELMLKDNLKDKIVTKINHMLKSLDKTEMR